jgi:hypothetical protein
MFSSSSPAFMRPTMRPARLISITTSFLFLNIFQGERAKATQVESKKKKKVQEQE